MKTITKDIEGIIFNILDVKDNDVIIDVLTKDFGFIQLYCKGVSKSKSKSFYVIQQFNQILFDVVGLFEGDLAYYRSGTVLKTFDFLDKSLNTMNSIMFISELLTKIKDMRDFAYEKYYLELKYVIEQLSLNKNNSLNLVNYFLIKTLNILGCQLTLDECVHCSSKNQVVAFDCNQNGFVCKKCTDKLSNNVINDQEFMQYLYHLNQKEFIIISPRIVKMTFDYLSEILINNTGVYLISKQHIYGKDNENEKRNGRNC